MSVPEAFAARFNRRDLDALLALFTERASLFYGERAGRASVRRMFERMYREGRDRPASLAKLLGREKGAAR